MIEAAVGRFPEWMCKGAAASGLAHVDGSRLKRPADVLSDSSLRAVQAIRQVPDNFQTRHAPLGKLIRQMLTICPRERPTARTLCKSEFFSMHLPE